jgi:hypothetical protein
MTDLTAQTAIAIKAQSAPGTYASPTSADALPAANISLTPQSIRTDNPEYTGTIHRPGAIVLGATWDVSFEILLRGPGGASPPAADAFILGRVLRALGFTENIISAAIPAAPEALGAGGTNQVTLGTSAAATAALYQGLIVLLAGLNGGTAPLAYSFIRSYSAAKLAVLSENAVIGAGNYQIPKQLAYQLSSVGTPPVLSFAVWQGNRRYNLVDCAPSSARITFPTSSRDSNAYPSLQVTFSGNLFSDLTEAAPVVTPALAIPPFKGGKQFAAGVAMGGSSVTLDLGVKVGFPPNPNQAAGNDPAQLTETRRVLNVTFNQVAKSYLDMLALAGAQTYQPFELIYGLAAGNYIGFSVTDGRFDFPDTSAGGDFYSTTGDILIDGVDKVVNLVLGTW